MYLIVLLALIILTAPTLRCVPAPTPFAVPIPITVPYPTPAPSPEIFNPTLLKDGLVSCWLEQLGALDENDSDFQ